ncbi:hypothetical protein J4447_00265 [Candidatus Pacearchaeota archaeon]|nr:hypothetical protein [Candidatus Pacearchaeota archaeon]
MEIVNYLEALGLTIPEAQIYLELLKIGESRTGKLCNNLDIPNSHVYRQLDSLIKKGLVTYKIANNVKIFSANSPESLSLLYQKKRDELKSQEKILEKAMSTLRESPKTKETIADYKYFEGVNGIKAMWLEINDLLIPKSEAFYYAGIVESWKALEPFYLEHHKIKSKKRVMLNMILPKDARSAGEVRKKLGYFNYRLLDIKNEGEFGVYENFIVIQNTSKKEKIPRAFLIKDQIFIVTFREIFNRMWEMSKK